MIEIIDEQERFQHHIGDSVFILRRMDAGTHAEIVRRHTSREKISGEWVNARDDQAILLESIDWLVTGWRKINHPLTKKEVPCTKENKIRLPIIVMEEIINVVKDATGAGAEAAKEELKNSKGSSS